MCTKVAHGFCFLNCGKVVVNLVIQAFARDRISSFLSHEVRANSKIVHFRQVHVDFDPKKLQQKMFQQFLVVCDIRNNIKKSPKILSPERQDKGQCTKTTNQKCHKNSENVYFTISMVFHS